MTIRSWFRAVFALFVAASLTALVGIGTCSSEATECADWHLTMNLTAFVAAGAFLLLALILALAVSVDAAVRRRTPWV